MPECPGSPVWDEVSGRTKWDEPAKRGDTSNPGTLSSNCGTKSEGYIGEPMADWDWKHGESSVCIFHQSNWSMKQKFNTFIKALISSYLLTRICT